MPNHWIMGAVTGVFVDAKQHVWVTHLPEVLTEEELYEEPWNVVTPPAPAGGRGGAAAPAAPKEKPVQIGTCCKAAPPVLEFDQQGKLVQGWGQGSYDDMTDWPREPHGIFVDHQDNVWVGSYNRHRVMKFTRDGKLLLTLGEYEKTGGSADTHLLGGPSGIWVDPQDQRSLHLGRLSQSPRDRVRRRDRQVSASLGRVRQRAGRYRASSIRRRW